MHSYARRQRWLAELQAMQTVTLLAQAFGGKGRRKGAQAERVDAGSLFDKLGKEI